MHQIRGQNIEESLEPAEPIQNKWRFADVAGNRRRSRDLLEAPLGHGIDEVTNTTGNIFRRGGQEPVKPPGTHKEDPVSEESKPSQAR